VLEAVAWSGLFSEEKTGKPKNKKPPDVPGGLL
jgi:hypothetical protein